ncbi:MAG: CoA transferase, partial [Bacteroidota bacterium]
MRILDFSHAIMGPVCGMVLGDLGAEVIHVEPPTGDPTRHLRGFATGYFSYFNRNKRSLALDLKSEAGQTIIHRLLEDTDVLIENFGPGTMERLGLGYEQLKARYPRLIYCALKGFLSGPYEHRHAMDEVAQMMGGLAYMTGPPGRPLRAGTSVIDITGGLFGVIGVQNALLKRERTGQGSFVKGALFETTAFLVGQHMACASLTDGPIPPMPARQTAWSIYRTFETQDGDHVFIGIISDRHWARFCEAFGRPEWTENERLSTNEGRNAESTWLQPAIETLMRGLPKRDILSRCEAAGIPFAPITRPEDLFDDPQLNAGAGLMKTDLLGGVTAKLPRLPLEIPDQPVELRRQPPTLGQHT